MQLDPLQVFDLVAVTLFVGSLGVSSVTIALRYLRYRSENRRVPRLLPRDLILVAGLFVPFLAILLARMLELAPWLSDSLFWHLITAVPAVTAAMTFAYYELFVVEK